MPLPEIQPHAAVPPLGRGRVNRRRVQQVVLVLGGVLLLALVWFASSFVTGRRLRGDLNWAHDAEAREQRVQGTLTIFTLSSDWKIEGQGSGFVIDSSGVGVTNVHVLAGSARAYAQLGNGRMYDILRIHAWDDDRDLVLFRLGRDLVEQVEWARGLTTLELSRSAEVKIGDWVGTVTSPKGFRATLSDGIVSAVRDEDTLRYLQITAPISPGSSGGPVFDHHGDVVGVAVSQVSDGQNLNFAIPVDAIHELRRQVAVLAYDEFQDRFFDKQWDATGLDLEGLRRGRLAVSLMGREEFRRAIAVASELRRRYPDSPLPPLLIGICNQQIGRDKTAAGHYASYLRLTHSSGEVREAVEGWLRERGFEVPEP